MADTVSLIKEKLGIAEFIRSYVELTPAGKNLKGLCPFHKEKTPSFIVSPDRGTWHCFGCGIGGDIIAFIMRLESLEFLEALKVLADRAGIPLERFGAAGEKQYAVLYAINAAAKDFFVEQLAADSAPAKAAKKYLTSRGLTDETIREFDIGFAPSTSDGLTRFLAGKGYRMPEIEKAGLVFKTERGTYWDRFRGRIMFPLMNAFGKTVGFTGRVLPLPTEALVKEGAHQTAASGMALAKYVNSPETPIFNKSKLLFGFHKSKTAIREKKMAVLVEGQMDMIMAWQDGVRNVIATSGTALTKEHLIALRRGADSLVLFFDADDAGQAAMERVIDLASTADFSVKVAYSPDGAKPGSENSIAADGKTDRVSTAWKDPADMVREKPGALAEAIEKALPAMQHYFRQYLGEVISHDAALLKRGMRLVLQKIAHVASPVERAFWVRELSHKTGLSEEHVFAELATLKESARGKKQDELARQDAPQLQRELSRRELVAEQCLGLMLIDSSLAEKGRAHGEFFPRPYDELWSALFSSPASSQVPVSLEGIFERIHLRSSLLPGETPARNAEFDETVKQLKREHFRALQEEWRRKIKDAEASKDEALLSAALAEFDRVSRQIYNS